VSAALESTSADAPALSSRPGDTSLAEALLASHPLRAVRSHLLATDETTLAHQTELTQIPAPPFGEEERARRMAELLSDCGAVEVRFDREGNVVARYPDPGPVQGPPVVVAAHLDTVFPAGTDVSVTREGDLLRGPGISDDGRGLAAVLALCRSLVRAEASLERPLLLAATVGEEGLGDLRGTRYLFSPEGVGHGAAAFLSLDGAGNRGIVHRGVGSRRIRLELTGPGGHSWSDWGRANPIHALARVLASLQELPLPEGATLSVGRIAGGESVNAIPRSAWAELEIRSGDEAVLSGLESRALASGRAAVDQANDERAGGSSPLSLHEHVIGSRPAGSTAEDSPLVRAAVAATYALGDVPVPLLSSTDANVPMARGVPAVTLGAGGDAGNAHTVDEWYRNVRGPQGIVRAALTLLTLERLGSPEGEG
jgi:acetylornithine deacetylase/succinyl-diaminopimelate desuccinylase-like protein